MKILDLSMFENLSSKDSLIRCHPLFTLHSLFTLLSKSTTHSLSLRATFRQAKGWLAANVQVQAIASAYPAEPAVREVLQSLRRRAADTPIRRRTECAANQLLWLAETTYPRTWSTAVANKQLHRSFLAHTICQDVKWKSKI